MDRWKERCGWWIDGWLRGQMEGYGLINGRIDDRLNWWNNGWMNGQTDWYNNARVQAEESRHAQKEAGCEQIWACRKGRLSLLIQSTGHCVVSREFDASHFPPPSSPLSLLLFLIMPFSPKYRRSHGSPAEAISISQHLQKNSRTKGLQCATSNRPWINPNHPFCKPGAFYHHCLDSGRKKAFIPLKYRILGGKNESRISVWHSWYNRDLGDNMGAFKGIEIKYWECASPLPSQKSLTRLTFYY